MSCSSSRGMMAWLLPAMLATLGLWLGFPSDLGACPPLILLYPAGILLAGIGASTPRDAFFRGWLTAIPGHALALYWISLPLSVVGGLPLAGSIPLAILVAVLLASQCGFFAAASQRFFAAESPLSAVCLGLVWYLLETAYAWAVGFPWLPVAGALVLWPFTLQAARIAGTALTGAFWCTAVFLLCQAALMKERKRLPAAAGFALMLLLSVPGALLLSANPAQTDARGSKSFPVLLVDGNIDQNQKWVETFRRETLAIYCNLTFKAIRERLDAGTPAEELGRGIILWPETAMPFDAVRSRYTPLLTDAVRSFGMPLLTGTPGTERGFGGKELTYNRAQLFSAAGLPSGHYDKEHLVPFGEYVPAIFNWNFLEDVLQKVGAYTPGTSTGPLRSGNLALGPIICYEAIFPWLAQDRVSQGANILVDISNDGWFGPTPAPRQHLALTALRAIEQNRWILRGTNTGISAVIDEFGRPIFTGPKFRADASWARAEIREEPSPYHRISPFIPPAAVLVLLLLLWRQTKDTRRHAATK